MTKDWQEMQKDQIGTWYKHKTNMVACVAVETNQDGKKWLHVSISRKKFLPSWEDVRLAKDQFIGKDKMAVQILPPESEYVNLHPYCFHLWHCLDGKTI